jgi:hypothetical protein
MGELGKPRSGNEVTRIFAKWRGFFKRNKIVQKVGVVFSAENHFAVFKKGKLSFFEKKRKVSPSFEIVWKNPFPWDFL